MIRPIRLTLINDMVIIHPDIDGRNVSIDEVEIEADDGTRECAPKWLTDALHAAERAGLLDLARMLKEEQDEEVA